MNDASDAAQLCPCTGLCHADAERAIRAGARTVKGVFVGCGVLPKCGECVWDIRELLQSHGTAAASAALAVAE